jgi:hypothetical protein
MGFAQLNKAPSGKFNWVKMNIPKKVPINGNSLGKKR